MDKIVLITGASRGIGAATALLAAQQGWAVAVNYHANAAAAQAVVDEVVTCSEPEILAALRLLAQTETLLVEGAAALAMAAFQKAGVKGQNNVVLLCGSNFDGPKLRALALG